MKSRACVNVKVERRSTFTFTRGFSYITSILFTHVKPVKVNGRTHVKITRQWKSTYSLHDACDALRWPNTVSKCLCLIHHNF